MNNKTNKTNAFWAGYDSKKEEVQQMGWIAARNAFNIANPPGQKWTGSSEGLQYAQGEFAALCDTKTA